MNYVDEQSRAMYDAARGRGLLEALQKRKRILVP